MRILLTGFMAAGKSTVGRILAPLLDLEFIDLDSEIEMITGNQIAGIFEDLGEGEFREIERKCLLNSPDHSVIATGGGCFIYNTEWMLKNGTVVYIDLPFPILASRIGADPLRPLWKNAEKLFLERESVYLKAPLIVNGANEPEIVAREIAGKLKRD